MISEDEIKAISIQVGVPIPNVEKDYVMGWLLWGIYNLPTMGRNLVLKGGNCLRKVYFPYTRFSDDLDFTAHRLRSEDEFRQNLDQLCDLVSDASGIDFDKSRTRVKLKPTPDKDRVALDGRVYFNGFAGDTSVTMRVKFDISEFERILLPIQWHSIIHEYSDSSKCQIKVQSYSIEEILAEKLRSWIQRTRSRDLFDVVMIVQSRSIPISKKNVLATFFQKTIFKNLPLASKEEMLYEPKFTAIMKGWFETIICPSQSKIAASNAVGLFKDFVNAIFDPQLLEALGVATATKVKYLYNIGSGYREAIIEAGRARNLIRLLYRGRNRDVEPYSFRFKLTKKGYGAEYFYGYDRTRGQTIKSFFLHQISGVSILPTKFQPRWPVEF
jgi:predicted nucleotidyltransferase component of viral defense system